MKGKSLSRVRVFATPWTAAHQAPPSMGFSKQEYWRGVPLSSPKNNLQQYINAEKAKEVCMNNSASKRRGVTSEGTANIMRQDIAVGTHHLCPQRQQCCPQALSLEVIYHTCWHCCHCPPEDAVLLHCCSTCFKNDCVVVCVSGCHWLPIRSLVF